MQCKVSQAEGSQLWAAPSATMMKRRRPVRPAIFSNSDSDDDDPPPPPRRLATPIVEASQQADSFDTYMASISAPSEPPLPARPKPAESPDTQVRAQPKSADDKHMEDSDDDSAGGDDEDEDEDDNGSSGENNDANDEDGGFDLVSDSSVPQSNARCTAPSDTLPPIVRLNCSLPEHLQRSETQIHEQLRALGVNVLFDGVGTLQPVLTSFHDLRGAVPDGVIDLLQDKFTRPTPVQAVCLPYALKGLDVAGGAQTGSGKTLTYALPAIAHAAAQQGSSRHGQGPAALVIAPTRDLALQITEVVNEFGRPVNVRAMAVVGGEPKLVQFRTLRDSGVSVAVVTPGRMLDMLRMGACTLKRCALVAVDEADRLEDSGFAAQLSDLLDRARPDAQRLQFSATLRHTPRGAVRVIVAGTAMVSGTVDDAFFYFDEAQPRLDWLMAQLPALTARGLLIVFCTTRGDAAELANNVRANAFLPAACIHGETDQADRVGLMCMFRSGELPVLVTTDVAARGLDIDGVHAVINYGAAKSWDWHIHRVGRSGRAETKGRAYTLMLTTNHNDLAFADQAVTLLGDHGRTVPPALLHLQRLHRNGLQKNSQQRKKRFRRIRPS